ncbi:hypothetical protein BT69DRAFT_1276129 [Atractiella rhizophila]|nr:hypothetical protein BT69DRAFT_1276129 [Atractiella rhizophila]
METQEHEGWRNFLSNVNRNNFWTAATIVKGNSGSDFIHPLVHNNTTSFENADKASLLHHAYNALHPNLTPASGSASPSSCHSDSVSDSIDFGSISTEELVVAHAGNPHLKSMEVPTVFSRSFGILSDILSTASLPLPTRLELSEEVETLQYHHLTETQTGRLFRSESLPSLQCSQRSTMVSRRQTLLFQQILPPSGSSFWCANGHLIHLM